MMLARGTPVSASFDIRTFECPVRDRVHQRVVALADPMQSRKAARMASADVNVAPREVQVGTQRRSQALKKTCAPIYRLALARTSWRSGRRKHVMDRSNLPRHIVERFERRWAQTLEAQMPAWKPARPSDHSITDAGCLSSIVASGRNRRKKWRPDPPSRRPPTITSRD